jgi:hypothetical protein
VVKGTDDVADEQLCGVAPSTSQQCDNPLLGCNTTETNDSDDDDIIVFGRSVRKLWFIIGSVFIGLFGLILSYMAAMCVTKGAFTLVARKELQAYAIEMQNANK